MYLFFVPEALGPGSIWTSHSSIPNTRPHGTVCARQRRTWHLGHRKSSLQEEVRNWQEEIRNGPRGHSDELMMGSKLCSGTFCIHDIFTCSLQLSGLEGGTELCCGQLWQKAPDKHMSAHVRTLNEPTITVVRLEAGLRLSPVCVWPVLGWANGAAIWEREPTAGPQSRLHMRTGRLSVPGRLCVLSTQWHFRG